MRQCLSDKKVLFPFVGFVELYPIVVISTEREQLCIVRYKSKRLSYGYHPAFAAV